MAKRNCITSFVCVLFFAYFYYQCGFLKVSAAYWPKLVCAAGLGLSLLECVMDAVRWIRGREAQKSLMPLSAVQLRRFLTVVLILVIWILCLNRIGFLVSSAAAMCAVSCIFEMEKSKKNMIRNVVVSLIVAALLYSVFTYLGIHFPKALLI